MRPQTKTAATAKTRTPRKSRKVKADPLAALDDPKAAAPAKPSKKDVQAGAKLIEDAINAALAPAMKPTRRRGARKAKAAAPTVKMPPRRGALTNEDVAGRASVVNPVTHCVVCGRYLKLHLNGLYAVELDGKTFHVGPTCAQRLPGTYLVKSFPKGWEEIDEVVTARDASEAAAIAFTRLAPPAPAPAPVEAAPEPAVKPLSKAEQAKRSKGKGKGKGKAAKAA